MNLPFRHARCVVQPLESTLTIRVSRGVGTGPTRLAAFDQALRSAGVADLNLVRLSSVIPPHSVVVETESAHQIRGGHGDLLYCVYSDAYSSTPGEAAWAGMTWAQHEDGSGAGLFAEHSGWSERDVKKELRHTMDDMIASRAPGYRTHGTMISSIVCESHPVCAIVLASYRCVSWNEGGVRREWLAHDDPLQRGDSGPSRSTGSSRAAEPSGCTTSISSALRRCAPGRRPGTS